MSKSVLILDYGHGNANSIKRALRNVGCNATYSHEPDEIENADAIIMPGVGHFKVAMQSMRDTSIISTLHQKIVVDKTPVLGICLGFQLMTEYSEEGSCDGLGWIQADTIQITPDDTKTFKVPHIGWRTLKNLNKCRMLQNIDYQNKPFYFCHKYAVTHSLGGECATYQYDKDYVGIYENDNIVGVQFHPEKSQMHGRAMIENFLTFF
ncbi:imidazole glycerol phosphate synthase subunit HisH [Gammaproteobacteria bacterium]|nr:imidazole glycerol phosphate synthase subunit HisH [Gammaproteobacteria bacterium]MDA9973598.1 imidazole glycerol phosphate synthase subunit HisH [Gammaproteobacteria bacterium]